MSLSIAHGGALKCIGEAIEHYTDMVERIMDPNSVYSTYSESTRNLHSNQDEYNAWRNENSFLASSNICSRRTGKDTEKFPKDSERTVFFSPFI